MEMEKVSENAKYGEKLVKCAFCGLRRPQGDMKGTCKGKLICKTHTTTLNENPTPELDKMWNSLD